MQLRTLLRLAAVAGILGQVHAPRITVADEPPRASIWGRTIAAEPYDKVAFREIRIPEWVQETVGVGYTIPRATQQPEARPLSLAVEGSSTVITVPRLEVHYVIVLDLASSD